MLNYRCYIYLVMYNKLIQQLNLLYYMILSTLLVIVDKMISPIQEVMKFILNIEEVK